MLTPLKIDPGHRVSGVPDQLAGPYLKEQDEMANTVDMNVRPALHAGVGAATDSTGRLRLMRFATHTHAIFEVTPPVLTLVSALDGTRTIPEILAYVRREHPDVTLDHVNEILSVLEAEGVLDHIQPDTYLSPLPPREQLIYERQLSFLRDFGTTQMDPHLMQHRIRQSRVAVLGMGGTGTWVAQSLAMAGVGRLRLVDADVVEASNLSRQVLYGTADLARPKVAAAAAALISQFGDLLSVEPIAERLQPPLDDLVADCDLVVNCADEPDINTTSQWVSESCLSARIPHQVGGGYNGHVGMIGPTIVPFSTACWTCFQRDFRRRNTDPGLTYLTAARKHRGALAAVAAVVTNLQVWDALRVLSGCGAPLLANRTGEIDFAQLTLAWTDVPRDADCPSCATH
jgi:molybdopterin/thiamine biosynthesis adenylyltransferase